MQFPGLIKRFNQKVIQPLFRGPRHELAHKRGLRCRAGKCTLDAVTPAGVANLANHDLFARVALAHPCQALQ